MEVIPNIYKPATLHCNNSGTVTNSREPRSNKRGKHIEIKYNLIREIVKRRDVILTKILTLNNLADPFTKTLTEKQFFKHVEGMGLRDMSHLL